MQQWKPVGLEVLSSLPSPSPVPLSPRTQTNPEHAQQITTDHNGSQWITTDHNRSQQITIGFFVCFFLTWLSGHTVSLCTGRKGLDSCLGLSQSLQPPQLGDTLPSSRLLLSCWHQGRTRLYGVTSAMPWSTPPLLSTAGVSGERPGPFPLDC